MEPSSKKKESAPGSRAANSRYSEIESINSPRTRHVDDNTGTVFSAFVFAVSFVTTTALAALFVGGVDIWTLCFGFFMAVLAASSIHVATQWERVEGPGLYFTIPFVERAVLRADMRTMLTGFGAEETLTSDLVPVDVDAAVFWMVWDPEKACMEVENYYDAVSMAAQTALRDAIGRKSISDITVHRDKLDQELRDKIEEKAGPWGISIISVEIDARIILAEVEKDVAAMLLEATEIYREDDMAFELRSMHLLNEGVKESNGTLVIPSAYSEGFKPSRPAR